MVCNGCTEAPVRRPIRHVYAVVIESHGGFDASGYVRREERRLRVEGFVHDAPASYRAHIERAVGTMRHPVVRVALQVFTDDNNELWQSRLTPPLIEAGSVAEFMHVIEGLPAGWLTAFADEESPKIGVIPLTGRG